MTAKNVTIGPEILERAGKAASAAGLTVDDLTSEALQRELGRRSLDAVQTSGRRPSPRHV